MPYGEQSLLCPKTSEDPDDQLHLVYASTGWTGGYKQAKQGCLWLSTNVCGGSIGNPEPAYGSCLICII